MSGRGCALQDGPIDTHHTYYLFYQLSASIKENPRLRAAAEALQKSGGAVNDAIAEAVRRTEESALYRSGKQAVRQVS